MLFSIKDGERRTKAKKKARKEGRGGEDYFPPPPFYLLSLTTAMPMNRAFQESGEGSEGRFANFLF